MIKFEVEAYQRIDIPAIKFHHDQKIYLQAAYLDSINETPPENTDVFYYIHPLQAGYYGLAVAKLPENARYGGDLIRRLEYDKLNFAIDQTGEPLTAADKKSIVKAFGSDRIFSIADYIPGRDISKMTWQDILDIAVKSRINGKQKSRDRRSDKKRSRDNEKISEAIKELCEEGSNVEYQPTAKTISIKSGVKESNVRTSYVFKKARDKKLVCVRSDIKRTMQPNTDAAIAGNHQMREWENTYAIEPDKAEMMRMLILEQRKDAAKNHELERF